MRIGALGIPLLCACSLVNEPDLGFLDIDASARVDADGDADALPDAEVDAADAQPDSGDGGDVSSIEICTPGSGDEDHDGLADCADLECADDAACCGSGEPVGQSGFSEGYDEELWHPFVEGSAPAGSPETGLDFGTSENGLLSDQPFDLTFGARITLELSARSDSDPDVCEGLAGCGDWVGVALTPVSTYTPGVALPTSLSVMFTARGELLVQRGGVIRHIEDNADAEGMSGWSAGSSLTAQVDVLPSGQGGQRGYRVEVRVVPQAGEVPPFFAPEGLVLDELDNGLPGGTPGAYLALMGRTTEQTLITTGVSVELLDCANPSVFRSTATTLTADSMGVDGTDWTSGSIGSPTASRNGASIRLLFEASDVDLGAERYRVVRRAVGQADQDVKSGDYSAEWDPVLGHPQPSIVKESYREPALDPDDPRTAWIAYDENGDGDGFELFRALLGAGWSLERTEASELGPADLEPPQASLRAPAFVARVDDEEPDRFHLWFVGLDAPGETTLWHAAGNAQGLEIETARIVLTPDDVGPAAARGIWDPFVLYRDGTFLIWFFAEDALGKRTLHHAVAPQTGDSVQLYDGNPVLDPQDPVLGGCADGCSFRGGGAVQEGRERRFFFGRSLGGETPVYQIVEVAQQVGGES